MNEERQRFERYMAQYQPSVWHIYQNLSTHDLRWMMAKSDVDRCWHLWQAAAA